VEKYRVPPRTVAVRKCSDASLSVCKLERDDHAFGHLEEKYALGLLGAARAWKIDCSIEKGPRSPSADSEQLARAKIMSRGDEKTIVSGGTGGPPKVWLADEDMCCHE
jgi:hypothetical protein